MKDSQDQGLVPVAGKEGYQPLGLSTDSVSSFLSLVFDPMLGPPCCEGVSSGMGTSRPGRVWGHRSALSSPCGLRTELLGTPPGDTPVDHIPYASCHWEQGSLGSRT